MENLFVSIREATDKDLPIIMQIEGLCFPHGAWKEENILYEMHAQVLSMHIYDRVQAACVYALVQNSP